MEVVLTITGGLGDLDFGRSSFRSVLSHELLKTEWSHIDPDLWRVKKKEKESGQQGRCREKHDRRAGTQTASPDGSLP